MKPGTTAAIVVFVLVALAHLLRLAMGWTVTIDTWNAPLWVSVLGVLVPAAIAAQLWRESRARAPRTPQH